MFCSISGEAPSEPVVSVKTGHVFEKRLIERHLQSTGKCPITGEDLSLQDLVAVQINKAVKPRPPSSTSLPGMIQMFQNEWDTLMLETFNLKKHLDAVRQELSHALYQHDAACRVIARLRKENASLRASLADTRGNLASAVKSVASSDAMEFDEKSSVPTGITEEIISHMTDTAKELSSTRRARYKASQAEATPATQLASFQQLSSHPGIHKTTAPGILCVDIHSDQTHVVTGGMDASAAVFDRSTGKILEKLEGHKKKVTSVKFHPSEATVFSTSADSTCNIWSRTARKKYGIVHTIRLHSGEVSGCSLHPTGDYLVTASLDKSWAFHDVATGITRAQVSDASSEYSSVSFHPDGLLLGTGTTDGSVKIWDVQSQEVVRVFDHNGASVTSLAFSENGFQLVTADDQGFVKLWDLRKTDVPARDVATGEAVRCVEFDRSGSYLAVAGQGVRVLGTKEWQVVKTFEDHGAEVTGVKFGANASWLVSTSMDRALKFYGKNE
eukprot:TRINITY_DN1579_c0_g1_i2.p1 TRINITY_DN1579_c0_g1~~TRINITY_DN1579_c0_g1_i2.p1  ORF type:complete len:499 (+),score=109.98 TRINITY_DN1579_c0_g1_i2:78-1574(+)